VFASKVIKEIIENKCLKTEVKIQESFDKRIKVKEEETVSKKVFQIILN